MEIKVVDKRGRVVVPAELRRRYNLKAGTKIVFIDSDEGVVIRVINKNYFESVAGVLGLKGRHLKSLMDGKRILR